MFYLCLWSDLICCLLFSRWTVFWCEFKSFFWKNDKQHFCW